MIEVKVMRLSARLHSRKGLVLNLLNEIFMRHLREATALLGIKVDVINPEVTPGSFKNSTIFKGCDNLHLVVLKGDKRKRKTWITTEPELQWNIGVIVAV